MTQSPQKPKPSFAREVAGGVAKDTGKVLGVVAFQAISIIALIVLGAVVCGAGLYFGLSIVAIIGGVLIGAGVLWAAVLLLLFFDTAF